MASSPRTILCPGCQNPIPLPTRVTAGLVVQCRVCGQQSRLEAAAEDPPPARPAPRPRPRIAPPPPPPGAFSPPPPPIRKTSGNSSTLVGVLILVLLVGVGIGVLMKVRAGGNLPPGDQVSGTAPGTGDSGDSSSPSGSTDSSSGVGGGDLAANAVNVLRKHCHRCHGDGGSDEGGFNFVLNRSRLIESDGFVVPGKPADSKLLKRIQAGEMPPDGDGQKVSPDEITALQAWIEAGAPEFLTQVDRPVVTLEQMFEFIRKNLLEETPEQDRRFVRYFTLTHLANAGLSDDEMETYRLALAKLLNSLSWNRQIVQLKMIDPGRTVVRVDLRDLEWTDEIWRKVIKADPYGIVHTLGAAKLCQEATECSVPSVRGDWFVFAASQPPLYYDVLGFPSDKPMDELERQLRLSVSRNIEERKVARAAFSRSGVSSNNRLIERHRSPYGALWVSYDFAKSTDRGNLFEHPIGPGNETKHFQHDGGEVIFNLPNGLQGYLLIDAKGQRLDKGPISIVSDPHRPDRSVVNGLSCMSCHYAGIIAKSDEVRATVEANRAAFPDATEIFNLYPAKDEMAKLQDEDAKRFVEAVKQVGVTRLSQTGEPVVNMALRFESDLDLKLASAELGLTGEAFIAALDKAPAVARVLGPLKVAGGTVKRDVFVKQFSAAAKAFQLGVIFRETEDGGSQVASTDTKPSKTTPETPVPKPNPERPNRPKPKPNTPPERTPTDPPKANPPAETNPVKPEGTGQPEFVARPLGKTGVVRNWVDRTGRFLVFGELMGVEEGKVVVVLKENGGLSSLNIDLMPDEDVRFVFDVVSEAYPLDLPGYVGQDDPSGYGPQGGPGPGGDRPPGPNPNRPGRNRPIPQNPPRGNGTPPVPPPTGNTSLRGNTPPNGNLPATQNRPPADLPMGELP